MIKKMFAKEVSSITHIFIISILLLNISPSLELSDEETRIVNAGIQ